jgi:hypothetical protein
MYATERTFLAGEWCVRCQQPYRRAEREIPFTVVSLFTNEVDVLNGLERMDTVSWRRGEPMPADPRLSGQERWVVLGKISLPDVITVAQALAIVHARLDDWGARGPDALRAATQLAKERASKIGAWIWFGHQTHRLTYARPTHDVAYALGPRRLKDLVPQSGEDLALQLDTGLLPLELRIGFRRTFVDERRAAEEQNSKVDLWIPVGPPGAGESSGLWVDRIEGEALRTWLATERLRSEDVRGVSVPLPYQALGRAVDGTVRPGTLDFARIPHGAGGVEPTMARTVGDSIAEWDWLEWEQIELLRRQCLVLVGDEGGMA